MIGHLRPIIRLKETEQTTVSASKDSSHDMHESIIKIMPRQGQCDVVARCGHSRISSKSPLVIYRRSQGPLGNDFDRAARNQE